MNQICCRNRKRVRNHMITKTLSPLVAALDLSLIPKAGGTRSYGKLLLRFQKRCLMKRTQVPDTRLLLFISCFIQMSFQSGIRFYRIKLWLWHSGSPLLLTLGGTKDKPEETQEIILGPDVLKRQNPQALVPANVWQTAKPLGTEPVLVSCVVAPGFHYDDFKLIQK